MLDLIDGRYADAVARLSALARTGTGRGQVLVQVMATPYLVEAAAHDGGRPAAASPCSTTGPAARRARRGGRSQRAAGRCSPARRPEAEREFHAALRLHPADTDRFERARTELLFGRELAPPAPAPGRPGAPAPGPGGVHAARRHRVGRPCGEELRAAGSRSGRCGTARSSC
ncbi:hypothetical protein V2I01_34510 [Micromonospora sp. BRA006-A]|nr:hypothetical protein [Micromonospora sp. BRA006-A]